MRGTMQLFVWLLCYVSMGVSLTTIQHHQQEEEVGADALWMDLVPQPAAKERNANHYQQQQQQQQNQQQQHLLSRGLQEPNDAPSPAPSVAAGGAGAGAGAGGEPSSVTAPVETPPTAVAGAETPVPAPEAPGAPAPPAPEPVTGGGGGETPAPAPVAPTAESPAPIPVAPIAPTTTAGGAETPAPAPVAPTAPEPPTEPTAIAGGGGDANNTGTGKESTNNATTPNATSTTPTTNLTTHNGTSSGSGTAAAPGGGNGADSSNVPSIVPSSLVPHHTAPSLAPHKKISGPLSPSHMSPSVPTLHRPTSSSFPSFFDDMDDPPGSGFGARKIPTHKPIKYVSKDDDPLKEEDSPATDWKSDELRESNEQLMRDKRLLITFGTLLGASFLLLVLTAQQLLENPHGCCASLCRMTVACWCCLVRCVCFPCRAMCGSRDRRTHDLMLTERNSYTHDLELN